MFGLLKKRVIREHAKLVIQNRRALELFKEYHADNDLHGLVTTFEEAIRGYQFGQTLSAEQSRKLLQINTELRRLFDQSVFSKVMNKSFDSYCRPAMGWKHCFTEDLKI